MEETTFDNKVSILAQFWMEYRDTESFENFIMYNDLGLPMAYAFAENLAKPTSVGQGFIEETFSLLLGLFNIEDNGYETLDDILEIGEVNE